MYVNVYLVKKNFLFPYSGIQMSLFIYLHIYSCYIVKNT